MGVYDNIITVHWARIENGSTFIDIGPINPDNAAEILRRKKDDLWDHIISTMKHFPEIKKFDAKHEFNDVLTTYINEWAAISWALKQIDVRADV